MYYYNKQQVAKCSPKLQALLWQQDHIIQANTGLSAQLPILTKIIRLAREEKQGLVYITATLNMLFFQVNYNEPCMALPYAALFLREGQTIFEESLSTEAFPYFQQNYTACFREICELYMRFYEISSEKMEKLFSLFKKITQTYGSELNFYESRLVWELMCRNKEALKKTCKHYETLSFEDRCYVCMHREVINAHILLGDLDAALSLCADFISGNIPSEALERYETCECANSFEQYILLMDGCLYGGRADFLDRVIPLLYQEFLTAKSRHVGCYEALIYALYGDFARFEVYIKDAADDWDKPNERRTPYDFMYTCLIWMAYFKLLSRSDTLRVSFPAENPLPLMTDSADKYSILEIADLFEQKADNIGMQFEKSRLNFAYAERKECFYLLIKMNFSTKK